MKPKRNEGECGCLRESSCHDRELAFHPLPRVEMDLIYRRLLT